MAFSIHKLGGATQDLWVADRRLWLTADRSEAVEDGDTRARFLLVAPGQTLALTRAKELGLITEPKSEPEPEPDVKEAEKTEDKEADKPEDKSRKKAPTKSRKKATKKKKTA